MGNQSINVYDSCLVGTPIVQQNCFQGFSWQIADRDLLITLVTEILIAHHDHVLKLLHGVAGDPPPNKETIIRSVVENVLAPITTDQDRYHRDGLLFQHISWIAAASKSTENDFLSLPHVRKADKGQDILIVHKLEDECFITIGEDKATINERATIRDKVFPEFTEYESGSRDNELESATLAILQRHLNSEQSIEVINGILWEKARRYRVVVTVSSNDTNDKDPRDLFNGYQDIIAGDDKQRRAETIAIPKLQSPSDSFFEGEKNKRDESEDIHALRLWFDSFSKDIKSRLQDMLGELHV